MVIRCSTQGAAQLPELRGAQRASSLASRGRAPPTLTSHQPTKQGGLESRGVDRWSSVGPAGGRESTLATSQVKPGAWALTQGSTVPFRPLSDVLQELEQKLLEISLGQQAESGVQASSA